MKTPPRPLSKNLRHQGPALDLAGSGDGIQHVGDLARALAAQLDGGSVVAGKDGLVLGVQEWAAQKVKDAVRRACLMGATQMALLARKA